MHLAYLDRPKRGLALIISSSYVETNLIIKGDEKQHDRELSNGVLEIPGTERRVLKGCEGGAAANFCCLY